MSTPFTKKLDPDIQAILAKPNVHMVGRGKKIIGGKVTNIDAWIVTVTHKTPSSQLSLQAMVPATLRGLPTDVVEKPQARISSAKKKAVDRTAKHRPAPGGVSIGHVDITAGTLGCLVRKNSVVYILSNNHVLANCNDGEIGDAIVQPGVYDGATPTDKIGILYDYVPYVFSEATCPVANGIAWLLNQVAKRLGANHRLKAVREANEGNLVDAALCLPSNKNDVEDTIIDLGKIAGESEPRLGMKVTKSGRTTEVTTGTISQTNVTANVSMGDGRIVTFTDCFTTEDMCDGGDSGSAALDKDNNIIGLLFAGSDAETIFCKYSNVKAALGLD